MFDGLTPQGPLLECFNSFPQFRDDLETLVKKSFLVVTGSESCKWLKSKTSLAHYFKWIGKGSKVKAVPGGFWAPIEKAFGLKRHTLRKLAGENGNVFKLKESKDFKMIKPILEAVRYQKGLLTLEKALFDKIKYCINMAEEENPESIHFALEKTNEIISYLNTFRDKNNKKDDKK